MASWRSHYLSVVSLLLARRKDLGLTQIELANQLGTSRRTFQRWESGEQFPSAPDLFRWADRLGVEIAPHLAQSTAASPRQAA